MIEASEDFLVPTFPEHVRNMLHVNLRGSHKLSPVFEVFQDEGDQLWRWRERASNGKPASPAGQHYFKKSNAVRAAYAYARKVDGSTVKVID